MKITHAFFLPLLLIFTGFTHDPGPEGTWTLRTVSQSEAPFSSCHEWQFNTGGGFLIRCTTSLDDDVHTYGGKWTRKENHLSVAIDQAGNLQFEIESVSDSIMILDLSGSLYELVKAEAPD